MAARVLRWLTAGMLLLWDRGFFSYDTVAQVLKQQAHLLARVKTGLIFQCLQELPDGSYLAKVYATAGHRRRDEGGILVRIIDYTFDDPGRPGSGQDHRLLTTLLDPELDPATDLIVLYHERWEEDIDDRRNQEDSPTRATGVAQPDAARGPPGD